MNINETITVYLVDKIEDISQTKWNKLLFFIDGAGVCLSDQFTAFQYIKLPYGPVPDGYTDILTEMHFQEVIKKSRTDNVFDSKIFIEKSKNHDDLLIEANKEIGENANLEKVLKKIVETFKNWTAVKLSDFSHELDAWKNPTMYSGIDLSVLKEDNFLKREFGEANFGKLLIN